MSPGTGTMPAAPFITAPAAGTTFALTDSITVTWTSETDPIGFLVGFGSDFPAYFGAPGTARERKVAASDVGVMQGIVWVRAFRAGSFTGPADADSYMDISRTAAGGIILIRR